MKSPELYQDARDNKGVFMGVLASSVFYVLYTGSGLVFFYLSIYPLDILFKPPWIVRPMFFFLCSLGVYLGLVDRYNSWQVVHHLPEILHAIHQAIVRPVLFLLMCGFSAVLWLFYGIFGLTMDGARIRYRKLRPA